MTMASELINLNHSDALQASLLQLLWNNSHDYAFVVPIDDYGHLGDITANPFLQQLAGQQLTEVINHSHLLESLDQQRQLSYQCDIFSQTSNQVVTLSVQLTPVIHDGQIEAIVGLGHCEEQQASEQREPTPEPPAPPGTEPSDNTHPLTGCHILIASSNPISLKFMSACLAPFNCQLEEADNGKQAVEKVANSQQPFDIIILERKLANIDGITAAKAIKLYRQAQQARLILTSTQSPDAMLQQADDPFIFHALLQKPVSERKLIATLTPLAKASQLATSSEPPADTPPAKTDGTINTNLLAGKKILLVEDNRMNRRVIVSFLENTGILLDTVEHGREALQMLNRKAYDLVFMDIQMPIMDGISATQKIRQQDKFTQLPIIAMTAHAQENMANQALRAGMNDYICKPLSYRKLIQALTHWLCPTNTTAASDTSDINRPQVARHEVGSQAAPLSSVILQLRDSTPLNIDNGLALMGGSESLYCKLINDFASKYCDNSEDIRHLEDQDDSQALFRITHSIKSNANYIGAEAIAELAKHTEQGLIDIAESQGFDIHALPPITQLRNCENYPQQSIEQLCQQIHLLTEQLASTPVSRNIH